MTGIASPVLYDPSIEVPEENEAGIGREIVATLNKIGETTLTHTGDPLRSLHAPRATGSTAWRSTEGENQPLQCPRNFAPGARGGR